MGGDFRLNTVCKVECIEGNNSSVTELLDFGVACAYCRQRASVSHPSLPLTAVRDLEETDPTRKWGREDQELSICPAVVQWLLPASVTTQGHHVQVLPTVR